MAFIVLFSFVLIEKGSYATASLLSKNEILIQYQVIPLYQPLTINRLATKYFGFKPEEQISSTVSSGTLVYPLKELELVHNKDKFNIFIIASDAAGYSYINKEITPNLEEFKKDAYSFENHFSGGNSTRFGIFSLMYGLNATYWFNFLNNAQGPVLFDILQKLGYDINIISSTDTNWPEFKKHAM